MAEWCVSLRVIIAEMSWPLHGRSRWRLAAALMGLLFARGRMTYSRWLVALGVGERFKPFYYFLGGLGRQVERVAATLLRLAVAATVKDDRILLALDDSPTERFGPKVEGAGTHRDPTPGPAGNKFLYGHIWVVLAVVVRHRLWHAIALPLRALLYIRRLDIGKLSPSDRKAFAFGTKLEQAGDLVEWAARSLQSLGKRLWVVVDGGYCKRAFLRRAVAASYCVVARLRIDAALWSLPSEPVDGKRGRGRPPIYGKTRIRLASRGKSRRGWRVIKVVVYGQRVVKRIKTFLATWKPAGGAIQVVLVDEPAGVLPLLCTDLAATVEQIVEAYADRAAIEQTFADLKLVHGWGRPQLRNVWANLAATHLALWLHTLIELWAWDRPHRELADRSGRPWDQPERRPSHADRKTALRKELLRGQFRAAFARFPANAKIRQLCVYLFKLAA